MDNRVLLRQVEQAIFQLGQIEGRVFRAEIEADGGQACGGGSLVEGGNELVAQKFVADFSQDELEAGAMQQRLQQALIAFVVLRRQCRTQQAALQVAGKPRVVGQGKR